MSLKNNIFVAAATILHKFKLLATKDTVNFKPRDYKVRKRKYHMWSNDVVMRRKKIYQSMKSGFLI